MKNKFRSIGRVALAMVLAVSLSLVMAAPVSALTQPAVTVDPNTAGATGVVYTITFTTTSDLTTDSTDKIYIEFPSGTGMPSEADVENSTTIEGTTVTDATVTGDLVELVVAANVPVGEVTVVFTAAAGIDNPDTVGTDFTLDVSTSREVAVTSGEYAITDATPPGTVILSYPNGSEKLAGGSTESITWTATDDIDDALTIKLEYNDGSGWTDIVTLADTSLTAYSWTVPSIDSTQCEVRITATDDAGNYASDVSNATFTIDSTLPVVVVTAPNGGEVWVAGSNHDITWTATDTDLASTPIDIDYSTDGGATWTSVTIGEANTGTYPWNPLPDVYNANSLVKVTATDLIGNSGSDVSNAVFTIDDTEAPTGGAVTAPNGGETWAVGSTQSITWGAVADNVDTATTIKLEYSTDAGSSWTEITTLADYTGTESYSWVIPSIDSANSLVKITATDDAGNSASDVSDAVFAIAAATEVWVGPNGHASYPGTEAMPFETIQQGIDQSLAGGIVNVLPGTYISAEIVITLDGLTLQSTGGPAVTIIDASEHGAVSAIKIKAADGVTVEGFTVRDSTGKGIFFEMSGEDDFPNDATIKNNVFIDITSSAVAFNDGAFSGTTISGNIMEDVAIGVWIGAGNSDMRILNNTMTGSGGYADEGAITFGVSSLETSAITISGNTITNNAGWGIVFVAYDTNPAGDHSDIVVEGNTISGNAKDGIVIRGAYSGVVSGLQILGNDITDNVGDGILIELGVTWGVGNVINNNNITGNGAYGIENLEDTFSVDAENNWWGDATGPSGQGPGTGDAVSTDVDYTPWLGAAYTEPTDPVTSFELELIAGWNLISLPLLPTDPDIDTVLAGASSDVTVDKVANYTGGPTGSWLSWFPPPTPGSLTEMNDGKGYWIDISGTGTLNLAVTGVELALPGQVPPTYDLVVGWNLIGFTSTAGKSVDVYLGSVMSSVQAMYKYDAATSAYSAILAGTALTPGNGYWLAVNAAGKIYP